MPTFRVHYTIVPDNGKRMRNTFEIEADTPETASKQAYAELKGDDGIVRIRKIKRCS